MTHLYVELARVPVDADTPVSTPSSDDDAGLPGSQFIRLSCKVEETLSRWRSAASRKHLDILKGLCHDAKPSQLQLFNTIHGNSQPFKDQWVGTTIKLEEEPKVLFHDLDDGLENVSEVPVDKIKICSNVYPRQAYCDWMSTTRAVKCKGGNSRTKSVYFTNIEAVESALNGGVVTECALRRQLQSRTLGTAPRSLLGGERGFLEIDARHLKILRTSSHEGLDGEVYDISWLKGTFARKVFKHEATCTREAAIAARVSHPHIVHIFGKSVGGTKHSLLMEVLNADLLEFVVKRVEENHANHKLRTVDEPPFSLLDTLDVLLQVAEGMKHLHANEVVHGDLKSTNILISSFEVHKDVWYYLVKVADFGQARDLHNCLPSQFRHTQCTTKYAAPEVLACRKDRNRYIEDPYKIDVYGFGIIAYEVLTGLKLYPNVQVQEVLVQRVLDGLRPSLYKECKEKKFGYPDQLIDLVVSCWDTAPERRPTFSEICERIIAMKMEVVSEHPPNILWRIFFPGHATRNIHHHE